MKKIAILASGSGTNAENITRLFHQGNRIRVAVVLANREKAGVHKRMQALDVPTVYIPNPTWSEEPQKVVDILREYDVDLVVLAGFMRKIDSVIIRAYEGRIINIHPSLLPAYGGVGMWGHHVHEAVIAAGEKQSGVTVHYVTDDIDAGEILMQQAVEIKEGDDAKTLESNIHMVEYDLYPRAIVAALKRLDESTEAAPATETTVVSQVDMADESAFASYAADDESAFGTYAEPLQEVSPKENQTATLTPEEEWAKDLGIRYTPADREQSTTPPPTPSSNVTPPPVNPTPQQTQFRQQQEPMPNTYLLWSVLMTICCCMLPGIVAIIFSAQVSSKYHAGDIEGAKRASDMAQTFIIISFVLGVLWNTLQLPLLFAQNLLTGIL